MITNKRRFIRLDEISEKTHLTKGDVLDAVESGKLRFCANIEAEKLGAIAANKQGQRKVIGVFDYSGMVKLFSRASKELAISNKAVSVREILILQPENEMNWKSVLDTFGRFDSARFDYFEKEFTQPNYPILAYSQIVIRRTIENVVGGWADTLAMALAPEKAQSLKEQFPVSDSHYLDTISITIEPNRVRIDLDDIEEIFGKESLKFSGYLPIDSGSSVVSSPVTSGQPAVDLAVNVPVISVTLTETVAVKPVIFTHPIEQIVHRVLIANPSLNADKIWVLIRKDVNQEGQRIYDIDNVIDEMTADSVSWFGKGESLDNEMSYDSFRKSTVYRVKKRLKEEDKS